MDASALTLASIEPALIAVIAALGTGGPGLLFAIYKWQKTAPVERDALIIETSERAVSLMKVAIQTAAEERSGLIAQVSNAHERIGALEARVVQLEECWPKDHPLPARA